MSPKFSPDGKWIAFASNRYGNNDVFVVPSIGGAATRLTFHSGGDDGSAGREIDQGAVPRLRNVGAFPQRADIVEALSAAVRKSCPGYWGAYGSYSRTGDRSPSIGILELTRQHYAAARPRISIVNPAAKTFTQLLPNERYNRLWPMWGATT